MKKKVTVDGMSNDSTVNPFLTQLFATMCFKAWVRYTSDLQKRVKDCNDEGEDYLQSDSTISVEEEESEDQSELEFVEMLGLLGELF